VKAGVASQAWVAHDRGHRAEVAEARAGRQQILGREGQHEDAEHEAEVAHAVREEGLVARLGRRQLAPVVPDEQVRADADELPVDEDLEEVVGQHDAEHREHEERQAGEEARHPRVALQVADAVDVDQAAHAGHDEQHDQREPVDQVAVVEDEAVGRQPGDRVVQRPLAVAGQHRGQVARGDAEGRPHGGQREQRSQHRPLLREERDQHRREQRQEQDQPGQQARRGVGVGQAGHGSPTSAGWRRRRR
jgi:hypothetical protein